MILPNEAKIIEIIKAHQNGDNRDNLCFIGQSGSGKSFTMQQIKNLYGAKNDKCTCFYLYGESQFDDRDYYAFNKFISEYYSSFNSTIKESIVELADDSPIAHNLMNHIAKNIVFKKNNDIEKQYAYLNNMEKEIVYKLEHILSNECGIVILDNLHYWDKRSLELLYFLLNNFNNKNNIFLEKTFIIIMTENQEYSDKKIIDDILKKLKVKTYAFPIIKHNEFNEALLSLGAKKRLDDNQIDILYPLVNGHIQLMLEIVDEINDDKIESLFNNPSTNSNLDYMRYLLETRLKELGASGEQIMSVLEYASIIGFTFSIYELESITRSNSYELRKIIARANQLRLINEHDYDEKSFAHEVIWAVFNNRTSENSVQYYSDLESCIAEIKPAHYLRRARYSIRAGKFEKSRYLYILEILKQIRIYGHVSSDTLREASLILNNTDIDYYVCMIKSYQMVAKKDYRNAIWLLETLENFYHPVLLAEKYILYSHILTKSYKHEDRYKAVECLLYYSDHGIIDDEKDVKERVNIRLLSGLCHIAKFNEAKKIEDSIYSSLGRRVSYDTEALYNLNLLRRRSNMLHGCETAIVFVNKAVDFFGPSSCNIPNNIRDYYISLGNQSCLLIDNGMFIEGYKAICTALNLESVYPEITFPRRQIIYNNLIISGFLSKNKSVSECIAEFEILIKSLPNIAEVFTYKSNLSVFYALSGQLDKAIKIIEDEAKNQNIHNDIEGYYKLRYLTNKSIYLYLSGDPSAYYILEDLPQLINTLVNSSYYLQQHIDLINIMKQGIKVTSPSEWLGIIHNRRPFFQNQAWKFFGLGFQLAPVSNWDT